MKTVRNYLFIYPGFLILLCFILLQLLSTPSFATIYHVPGDFSKIKDAVNSSSVVTGDEVIVHPGTYVENIVFPTPSKNIILRSTDPTSSSVVAATIISAATLGSVITFQGGEGPSCVLSGFTITNGYNDKGGGIKGNSCQATIQYNVITGNTVELIGDVYGGGIYGCDGIIQYNVITANTANGLMDPEGLLIGEGYGGGLYLCSGTIQYNTISNNVASGFDYGCGGGLCECDGIIQNNTISGNDGQDEAGGLIYCDNIIKSNIISGNTTDYYGGGMNFCGGTIQNNTISDNIAWGAGGGLIWCNGTIQNNIISGNYGDEAGGGLMLCDGTIQNNTISLNTSQDGGGLNDCDGIIQNNTIYKNTSTSGGGGGIRNCNATIKNCIVWQNIASMDPQLYACSLPSYCCIQDWSDGGTGNITDDPFMVDPLNGDFHLQSNSPCIDAGCTVTLYQDFEGELRPYDGTSESRGDGSDVDIGADEYLVYVSLAVFSDHDTPVPPVGINMFSLPTLINASMTNPIVTDSGTRHLCIGWLGEGAVPASGSTTNVTFDLDTPSTITWLWDTQYNLMATADPPAGGSVTLNDGITPATGWYDEDANITVRAMPSSGYKFDNWSVDLSGSNNPESLIMDSPKNIVAHFSVISRITDWQLFK